MRIDPTQLIGTTVPAPLQDWMLSQSMRSWDYASAVPYPRWEFQRWPRAKGPRRPTPSPTPAIIVLEGADFLFRGGPPRFSVPFEENAALETVDAYLTHVIQANRLAEQWHALGESCGHQGAIAAKFSYDGGDPSRPVRINFLDVPQECRVWFDPHDAQNPIFARIQYPYRDLVTGDWYYYREEWTEEYFVTYRPRFAAKRIEIKSVEAIPGYLEDLGDADEWTVDAIQPNPFGVIPVTVIRNRRRAGSPVGDGDLWRWFALVDRLALTLHDADRWNQKNAEPNLAFLNAKMLDGDPLEPGEPIEVWNEDPDKSAGVELLEATGAARGHVEWYVQKMEKYAWHVAGYSLIDLEEVANKGAWTQLAFEVTYAKTIATTDKKRELWGQSGLCVFFRNLLLGLANMGGIADLGAVDEETAVSVEWEPYFEPTDQDKAAVTQRTIQQQQAGLLTRRRAAQRLARMEGVPAGEIPTLLDEVEQEAADDEKAQAAVQAAAVAQGTASGGGGGVKGSATGGSGDGASD